MNKKTKIISIFIMTIILSIIIFSGCNKGIKKITKPVDIISIQHDEEVDKDGTILIEYTIKYPQIKEPGTNAGLLKINKFFKEEFDEMTIKDCKESKRMAEEAYEEAIEGEYEFRPHALGSDYEVTYNDEGLLSITLIEYTYWGGVHPNSYRESFFFDINAEQKLNLGKLYKTEQKEALNIVLAEVKDQIEAGEIEELYLFDEGIEILEKAYFEDDFYFDGENIVIYFQQYAIGPYSIGFPEFKIPKENIPYFQKK